MSDQDLAAQVEQLRVRQAQTDESVVALATAAGLEFLLEEYPPFTAEFLARYPSYAGRDAPEYLILGYRRS